MLLPTGTGTSICKHKVVMAAQPNIRSSFAGVLFRLIIVIFCLSAWKSPSVMAQDTTAKKDCNEVEHPPTLKAIKMMAGTYSADAMQKKVEGTLLSASRSMLMAKSRLPCKWSSGACAVNH